jgi:formylglycine-generating enzyme required for sulfatase activity
MLVARIARRRPAPLESKVSRGLPYTPIDFIVPDWKGTSVRLTTTRRRTDSRSLTALALAGLTSVCTFARADDKAAAAAPADMKAFTETIPGTDVKFKMVPIPGGTFTMGSPETEKKRGKDEGPQVQVKVEPFYMEEHEVTWGEY